MCDIWIRDTKMLLWAIFWLGGRCTNPSIVLDESSWITEILQISFWKVISKTGFP